MITALYYSITNGGDGSAGIHFFESQELAEMDQRIMNESGEGWAEDCSGVIALEALTTIKTNIEIITKNQIKEDLATNDTYSRFEHWKGHI